MVVSVVKSSLCPQDRGNFLQQYSVVSLDNCISIGLHLLLLQSQMQVCVCLWWSGVYLRLSRLHLSMHKHCAIVCLATLPIIGLHAFSNYEQDHARLDICLRFYMSPSVFLTSGDQLNSD